jgi:cell division protein FtsI (penicillin-binding protein 3)
MGRKRWRPQHVRLVFVGAFFLVAWAAIGIKLVFVQGVQAQTLEDQALDQRLRTVTLEAERGTIYDRDGRELALTIEATTVYANPYEIEDAALAASALSGLLGRPVGELQAELEQDTSFVYLARKLMREEADAIRALELPGVHTLDEPKRVYPSGDLAAQVLGFVGTDNGGLEGIEQWYEDVLSGEPGRLVFERSGRGRVIPQGQYEVSEAVRGRDITLTIDGELQFHAQEEALRTLEETGATGVHIVVLDVTTFDVLAMASAPSFNPNEIGGDPALFRNRVITDTFEPGSTQKLITIAAAIEEGVVTPDRIFEVPDRVQVFDREYFDFTEHDTQDMTVADIVARSSNVGTILVWQELGNELLYRYLQGFGLGTYTGIDFPGEAPGLVRPADEWCESCGASTSIGYRVAVTPLQMTSVFATVANKGVWMQPQVVESITGEDGTATGFEQRSHRVLSEETAVLMRNMLTGVVQGGTGRLAQVAGYAVGGKTGTTEKFEPDLLCPGAELPGCYGDDVVASFIGIGPIDDPRLAVGVFVDSPSVEKKRTGGVAAAPTFSRVMRFSLHQLGVPPDVG